MKVKCLSVRLKSLCSVSEKAYLAEAFDGSTDVIPKSQVFGTDYGVQNSEAYWISEWILSKKKIQYSSKKVAWFDKDTGRLLPTVSYEKHQAPHIESLSNNEISSLSKSE